MDKVNENKTLSCGVLVVDKKNRILMFDVDRTSFWDIPKGGHEPGETPIETALRELKEETSLVSSKDELIELGVYPYNFYKDLYLFLWFVEEVPLDQLMGESRILKRPGNIVLDDQVFSMVPVESAPDRMCKSLYWLFTSKLEREIAIEASRDPVYHKIKMKY